MQSFETMFDAALAGDAIMSVGFIFGDEPFVVQIENGTITTRRGPIISSRITSRAQRSPIRSSPCAAPQAS